MQHYKRHNDDITRQNRSLTTSSTKEAERNLLKCLLLHVDIAAIIFGYIKKSFLISQGTKKKKGRRITLFFVLSRAIIIFFCIYMYVLFHRRVIVMQIGFLEISAIFRNCFIFLSAGGVSVGINWTAQIFSHEIQL